jgi:hypothetical protein
MKRDRNEICLVFKGQVHLYVVDLWDRKSRQASYKTTTTLLRSRVFQEVRPGFTKSHLLFCLERFTLRRMVLRIVPEALLYDFQVSELKKKLIKEYNFSSMCDCTATVPFLKCVRDLCFHSQFFGPNRRRGPVANSSRHCCDNNGWKKT